MQIDWEFARSGQVIRTGSSFIPEGGVMAVTVMAVPDTVATVAPAAVANKGRFAFLLTAKDAVLNKVNSGASALQRLAEKAHLGGAVRWLRDKFSWAIQKMSWIPRILGKTGLAGLAALALTTKTGHNVIKTVVGAVLKPIGWAISKVYAGFSWCMRLFGDAGKRLANRMDARVFGAIETVIDKTAGIRDWIANLINPDNRPQRVVAGIGKGLVAQALIAAVLPGGWAYLGYLLAAPLLFEQARPTALKKVWEDTKEAAATPPKRVRKAPAQPAGPSFTDRVAAKKVEAQIRVEDDKFDQELKVLEGEVMDAPVLSTNASKAQRRRQAEAARKENERQKREEAAERRAQVLAKTKAAREAAQAKAHAAATDSGPVLVTT